MPAYQTLAEEAQHECVIKKSRFLTFAAQVNSPDEALKYISSRSVESASHNCWAYRIQQAYRFNDDGEPSGTAGQPILSAIEGAGLDHTVILVVRHFGGIKLGAGGLIRAYRGSAAACLSGGQKVDVFPQKRLEVNLPFDLTGTVHHLIAQFCGTVASEDFDSDGVTIALHLSENQAEGFCTAIRDASGGRCLASIVEN